MVCDFTNGKMDRRYLLLVNRPNGCIDKVYYHYLKDAKDGLNMLLNSGHYEKTTVFNIYDMDKDVRKYFVRL